MKKTILFLPLLFVCITGHGQTIPLSGFLPNIKTAEAYAVERYSNYPMDYSTGLPNITIPLYEINTGDITLPITLTYHSSGFRPNEAGGRIATGWTLNAEPSISKEVRGIDDLTSVAGYVSLNPELYKIQHGAAVYEKRIADGVVDAMSDIYYYKLAEQSGSFFIDGGKQFVIQPHNDLKVSWANQQFILEDDKGISYAFGGNGYTETYQYSSLPLRHLCNTISSKMTGAQLSFVYNSSGLANFDYKSYIHKDAVIIENNGLANTYPLLTKSINGVQRKYFIQGANTLTETTSGSNYIPYAGSRGVTEIMNTQSLSAINFDNGSVVFTGDNRSQINIKVKDKSGTTIKEIKLYCSPYSSSGTPDLQHRKLDSIRIGVPGGDMRKYAFEYNEFPNMPARDTRGIDYWGFYNGQNSTTTSLVPNFSTTVTCNGQQVTYSHTDGMDRAPHVAATKAGVLRKVTDPNGLETSFEYEGNKTGIQDGTFSPGYNQIINTLPGIWILYFDYYSPQLSFDIPVGGLRIKQIKERDSSTGEELYRDFTYGCLTQAWGDFMVPGWGVPRMLPGPTAYLTSQDHTIVEYTQTINANTKTWYCNPVSNITFNGGSPILYSYVEEKTRGAGNDQIWSEYYYTTPMHDTFQGSITYDNNCNSYDWDCKFSNFKISIDQSRNTTVPFSLRSFPDEKYGKLQKRVDYEELPDGSKRTARKEEYTNRLVTRQLTSPMWSDYVYRQKTYTNSVNSLTEAQLAAQEYFMRTYPDQDERGLSTHNIVETEKVTEYFPTGGSVTTTKNIRYTNLPGDPESATQARKRSVTTLLNGSKQKEEYFTYSDGKYTLAGYPETLYPTSSTSNHPGGILTEHKTVNGTDTSYIRQKLELIGTRHQIKLVKTKSVPGNNFDTALNMKYDSYGNISETVGSDGIPTTYIWSYNNQYVVAKVENATIESVTSALSLNLSTLAGIADLRSRSDLYTQLDGLRGTLTGAQVYTYLYKPLVGITSSTDPSGTTTYYEYDSSNRLKRAFIKEGNTEKNIEMHEYNLKK